MRREGSGEWWRYEPGCAENRPLACDYLHLIQPPCGLKAASNPGTTIEALASLRPLKADKNFSSISRRSAACVCVHSPRSVSRFKWKSVGSRALGARTRHWHFPGRDADSIRHSRLTVYSPRRCAIQACVVAFRNAGEGVGLGATGHGTAGASFHPLKVHQPGYSYDCARGITSSGARGSSPSNPLMQQRLWNGQEMQRFKGSGFHQGRRFYFNVCRISPATAAGKND